MRAAYEHLLGLFDFRPFNSVILQTRMRLEGRGSSTIDNGGTYNRIAAAALFSVCPQQRGPAGRLPHLSARRILPHEVNLLTRSFTISKGSSTNDICTEVVGSKRFDIKILPKQMGHPVYKWITLTRSTTGLKG